MVAKKLNARSNISDRYLLTISSLLLLSLGIVMVFSASSVFAYSRYGDSFFFFKKQIVSAVIAIICMVLFTFIPYRFLQKICLPAMIISIVSLAIVFIPGLGNEAGGASRWLNLGFIKFQPSEFAKAVAVLYVADLYSKRRKKLVDLKGLITPMILVLGPMLLLIVRQKDLGTTITIALTVFVMMYFAGARLSHLFTLAVTGLGGTIMLIFSEGYRRARFLTFFNPWADPTGHGFQIVQGLIAIGSGGLFGKGLGMSRQKFFFLPNPHTDYIFAIISEELGLFISIGVVALFVALVFAGIRISLRAPDRFGMLLGGGIASLVGLQALINIGGVTGTIPLTGIPLPLVSYGGSSLILFMSGIGILLNLSGARKLQILKGSRDEDINSDRGHRRTSVSRDLSRRRAVRRSR